MAVLTQRDAMLAAERHQFQVRRQRYEEICKLMPADATPRQYKQWRAYVWTAVCQFGAKSLKRVVWPWAKRPEVTHTPRGKIRPNRDHWARQNEQEFTQP